MFAPAEKPWMVGGTVSNVANFTPGDEGSMRAVVGLHNPVSVAFEVVPDLRHYASVRVFRHTSQARPRQTIRGKGLVRLPDFKPSIGFFLRLT